MTVLLSALLGGISLLLLLPTTVLFIEVLLATKKRPVGGTHSGDRPRLAVLIPAHNEAAGIARTLRSLTGQLKESDRLMVVADNCTDDTAHIAGAEGAEVVTRQDMDRRGKGYALDYGVRALESNPPQVVIIIDADCEIKAGAIDLLARHCDSSARPVQSLYMMHAPKEAGLGLRIAEFAWVLKNHIRPAGLHRLGLPCQLMGTGMAFPWQCISTAQLATGHIVEDLKLGIDLARAGWPPSFCPEALVTSEFPESRAGAQMQRTRWEHGHLSVILSETPGLLRDFLKSMNASLLALALDLTVPPVSLLILLIMLVWSGAVLLYAFAKVLFPLYLMTSELLILSVTILLSWASYGRDIVSFGTLARAPVYALRKIPLYVRFLLARQLKWVRADRDKDKP